MNPLAKIEELFHSNLRACAVAALFSMVMAGAIYGQNDTPPAALLTFSDIEARWGTTPRDKLEAAAQSGDVTAQSLLGWQLLYGRNQPTNHTRGANWLRQAAEKGFAYAQFQFGWIHEEGRGVTKNREIAMDWTIKSADQGFTPAEVNLGWMHSFDKVKPGQTVTGNYPEAAEWYTKAAQKGHANAQFLLAEIYHEGKLGNDQRTNCIPWFLKAAKQGHAKAQAIIGSLARYYPNNELLKSDQIIPHLRDAAAKGELSAQLGLARRLRDGDGVAKNPTEALQWMKRAASNQARNTRVSDAQYELASMYETGAGGERNLSEAWRLYLFASGVSPHAQYRVGRMYEEGTGVPTNHQQAAEFYWMTATRGWGPFEGEAAERLLRLYSAGLGMPGDKTEVEKQLKRLGNSSVASVQFQLGEIYYSGKAGQKDDDAAVEHYTKAATLGSAEAQSRIGQMWATGLQGKPDLAEAASWYRKAAMQGLAEAQFNLGAAYANGTGVKPDPVEALRWLYLAASQGHGNARKELDELEKRMTPEQIAEAVDMGKRSNPVRLMAPPITPK